MDQEEGEICDNSEETQDYEMQPKLATSNGFHYHPSSSASSTNHPGSNNTFILQSAMHDSQLLELRSGTDTSEKISPRNIFKPRHSIQQPTLTIQEMRRKAQAAVMYLACSLKLSFHDIIDEGVDKDVLRSIFEQLRLPIPPVDDKDSQTIRVVGKHGGLPDLSDNPPPELHKPSQSMDYYLGENDDSQSVHLVPHSTLGAFEDKETQLLPADGDVAQNPGTDTVAGALFANQGSFSEIDRQSNDSVPSNKAQTTPLKVRKRPVATDFNSEPIFTQSVAKHRKFGDRLAARDARLVIDVSDEEGDIDDYNMMADDRKMKDSPQPGAIQMRSSGQSNIVSNGSNAGPNFALSQAIRDQEKKIEDLNKMIQQRSRRQKNLTSAANTPPVTSSKPATPVPNPPLGVHTTFTLPDGFDVTLDRALASHITPPHVVSTEDQLFDEGLNNNAEVIGVVRSDDLLPPESVDEVSQMKEQDSIVQLCGNVYPDGCASSTPKSTEKSNPSISLTNAIQKDRLQLDSEVLGLDYIEGEENHQNDNEAEPYESDTTSDRNRLEEESAELEELPSSSTDDRQTNSCDARDSALVHSSPMNLASPSESRTSSTDNKQAITGPEVASFDATGLQNDESCDQFFEESILELVNTHEKLSVASGHAQGSQLTNEPNELDLQSSETPAGLPDITVALDEKDNLQPSLATPKRVRSDIYSSPLAVFKSFRYHPRFLDLVSGGFKSLTYSHMIDPNRLLCHYETQGGSCNDESCTWQHFRQITMPDDRILLELASTEGVTEEEQINYKQRLHSEIIHLTRSGIQDFATVASKIVEFRRNYLADETRVLRNI